MIILVTGGRDYADKDAVECRLGPHTTPKMINGDGTGADRLCREYALQQRMVDMAVWLAKHSGKRVIVEAFPGGAGTADCVRRAKAAGLEVRTG